MYTVYTKLYSYSYLKFICNGLMGEHDMYFVDTKNVEIINKS